MNRIRRETSLNTGLIEDLVKYEKCHHSDISFVCVGPAVFKQDFGPWNSGCKVGALTLDYARAYLEEFDEKGEVVKKCAVKLHIDHDRKVKPPDDEEE